jgi:hypothetical protein
VRYPWHRRVFIVMAGLLASPVASAGAASTSRKADRDAGYLQEAFGHDLCTRNDRELRTLTKALSKKPGGTTR